MLMALQNRRMEITSLYSWRRPEEEEGGGGWGRKGKRTKRKGKKSRGKEEGGSEKGRGKR